MTVMLNAAAQLTPEPLRYSLNLEKPEKKTGGCHDADREPRSFDTYDRQSFQGRRCLHLSHDPDRRADADARQRDSDLCRGAILAKATAEQLDPRSGRRDHRRCTGTYLDDPSAALADRRREGRNVDAAALEMLRPGAAGAGIRRRRQSVARLG